jgi:outer membrane receptor protein involved in Fe transport
MQGKTAPAVRGRISPTEALDQLLDGSRLRAVPGEKGGVALTKISDARSTFDKAAANGARLASAEVSAPPAALPGERRVSDTPAVGAYEAMSPSQVAEIVVTAQKREERLIKVPISISVLGGDRLDRGTSKGVSEELNRVAGVSAIPNFHGGGTRISIRGVGAGAALYNGANPIGYYLDGVPFGFVKTAAVPDASGYDLARVEVLRGPQGTLYGASSLNGVVRILTNDADLDQFDAKGRALVSSTKGGGENYRGDLAVNVPLIEGKLAARAVVGYQDLSGWIDKPFDKNANDSSTTNVRLKINAAPTEDLTIALSGWHQQDRSGAPPGADDNGVAGQIPEPQKSRYTTLGARIGYAFPGFSVESTTSYLNYKNRNIVALPPSTGLLTIQKASVFAEEILLNSTSDGPWKWSAGMLYRDAKDRSYSELNLLPAPVDQSEYSKSVAIFGEIGRFLVDDRLELKGGLRWFRDRVRSQENIQNSGNPADPLFSGKTTFHNVSPRIVMTYYPSDNSTIYASYSQGFRSGAFQAASIYVIAPFVPPLRPDKLKNYEIGSKGRLFDNVIDYDMAVYFMDWSDIQQSIRINYNSNVPFQAFVNAASASGLGFDLNLSVRPAAGVEVGGSFSWNDLSFDDDVPTVDGLFLFRKGDRVSLSPKYTAGGWAALTFPLGAGGFESRLSVSGNFISKQSRNTYSRGRIITATSDKIFTSRADLEIISPSNWTLKLFVDNLNNTKKAAYRDFDLFRSTRLRPRTFGLQIDYKLR